MRALVTGATGFVGGHLVRALRARGDQVTALVRSPEKARALEAAQVHLVRGDLDNTEALARAVAGQDVIYHVAGLVAARSEAEFLQVNRDGTSRLLEAALAAGAPRFILVSSAAAGGPALPGKPRTGSEPAHPVTAYGRSKLAGEDVVRSSALPWIILRPPAVYGPGDREVLKVFKIAKLGVAPVFGGGHQELSLVYGPDLGEALAAAGHADVAGRIYYPCHPEIITSGTMVREIGRAMGKSVSIVPLPQFFARGLLGITGLAARLTNTPTILTPDKANEFFQPAWTGDPSPMFRETGWRAEHDFAAGARETLAWYRQEGWI
ncbi:MAG: NAD(P)-dependent oxidoreductase [Gemmatimonadota bacterium]